MPNLGGSLFGRNFADMQARHLTFEEAVRSPEVFLMSRQRLVMIWRDYQQAISQVDLF